MTHPGLNNHEESLPSVTDALGPFEALDFGHLDEILDDHEIFICDSWVDILIAGRLPVKELVDCLGIAVIGWNNRVHDFVDCWNKGLCPHVFFIKIMSNLFFVVRFERYLGEEYAAELVHSEVAKRNRLADEFSFAWLNALEVHQLDTILEDLEDKFLVGSKELLLVGE